MRITTGEISQEVALPQDPDAWQKLASSLLDSCLVAAKETPESLWGEVTLAVSTQELNDSPLDLPSFASQLQGNVREAFNTRGQSCQAYFIWESPSTQPEVNPSEAAQTDATRVRLALKKGTTDTAGQMPDSGDALYKHLEQVAFCGLCSGGKFRTDEGIVEVGRDSGSTDSPIFVSLQGEMEIIVTPNGISGIYVRDKSFGDLRRLPVLLARAQAIVKKCTSESFLVQVLDISKALEEAPLT